MTGEFRPNPPTERRALETADQSLEAALNCFAPPLAPEARARVAATLQDLAQGYRALVARHLPGPVPMRKMYTLLKNINRPETDDEYRKRVDFWKREPRRGRPRNLAAQVLVAVLRDLLMEEGCHYGAPKEGTHTRLPDLARLVHRLSEVVGPEPGWQDIAENCADPLFRFELSLGKGLSYDPTHKTDIKRMLAEAEVLPTKRKRPSKRNR